MGIIMDETYDGGCPEPIVVKRCRGDWFAVTGKEAEIRIGVIGNSEEDARAKFAQIVEGWRRARDAERATRAGWSPREVGAAEKCAERDANENAGAAVIPLQAPAA